VKLSAIYDAYSATRMQGSAIYVSRRLTSFVLDNKDHSKSNKTQQLQWGMLERT